MTKSRLSESSRRELCDRGGLEAIGYLQMAMMAPAAKFLPMNDLKQRSNVNVLGELAALAT
jgi:hypothetical protein